MAYRRSSRLRTKTHSRKAPKRLQNLSGKEDPRKNEGKRSRESTKGEKRKGPAGRGTGE